MLIDDSGFAIPPIVDFSNFPVDMSVEELSECGLAIGRDTVVARSLGSVERHAENLKSIGIDTAVYSTNAEASSV